MFGNVSSFSSKLFPYFEALFYGSESRRNRKWEVGNGNAGHENTYSALF